MAGYRLLGEGAREILIEAISACDKNRDGIIDAGEAEAETGVLLAELSLADISDNSERARDALAVQFIHILAHDEAVKSTNLSAEEVTLRIRAITNPLDPRLSFLDFNKDGRAEFLGYSGSMIYSYGKDLDYLIKKYTPEGAPKGYFERFEDSVSPEELGMLTTALLYSLKDTVAKDAVVTAQR